MKQYPSEASYLTAQKKFILSPEWQRASFSESAKLFITVNFIRADRNNLNTASSYISLSALVQLADLLSDTKEVVALFLVSLVLMQ